MADKDENNDASASAAGGDDAPTPASAAAAGLDDFAMDIDGVAASELSDGDKSPDDAATPTEADDGGEDMPSSSGGIEGGAEDASANDEECSANASDKGAKRDDEAGDGGRSPKVDEVTAGDLAAGSATDSDDGNDAAAGKALFAENDDAVEENDGSDNDDDEQEELWDLKMVLKAAQIRQPGATRCATDGCGLVASCIWSSSLDPETPWYTCLDCQTNDFGGWPDDKKDIPIKVLDDDWREAMMDKCTNLVEPDLPDLPSGNVAVGASKDAAATTEEDRSSSDGNADASAEDDDGGKENESPSNDNDDEVDEDLWELTKIFLVKELTKAKPVMCSYGEEGACDLVACSRWENSVEGTWYSCLDCQENDYGGWPEEKRELPVDFLTEENRRVIAEKCSAREDPPMPDLPLAMPLLSTKGGDGPVLASITPPPGHDRAVAENQSDVVVGAARGGKKKKLKGGVTPSPMPPKGAPKIKPAPEKPKVMSKKSMEMHARWQAEATKLGGPGAKIVVNKPEAKKLVFDKLHDGFCPMNINELYTKLKAVIPSAILKSCLDDMIPDKYTGNPFADDSDDDGEEEDGGKEKKKKKKGAEKSDPPRGPAAEEYAKSLRLKEGRNVNNNLYYVDHTRLSNEGNGLRPDVRNELVCDMQKSKAELDQLAVQLKSIASEAAQLESEPKNEELILEVADLEKKMGEMSESVEDAKAHAANEKHAKQVKRGIDTMGTVWRKRKRQCTEFLMMMDESTEGTISLKKCLKGDGPIDIDSDEAAIKGAITFAQRKKTKISRGSLGGIKGDSGCHGGLRPDENFVGVKLGRQGKPERVFMGEE